MARVPEDKLARVLNAFVQKEAFRKAKHGSKSRGPLLSYVQGMNILAAPILFTMPEVRERVSGVTQPPARACSLHPLTRHPGLGLSDAA